MWGPEGHSSWILKFFEEKRPKFFLLNSRFLTLILSTSEICANQYFYSRLTDLDWASEMNIF